MVIFVLFGQTLFAQNSVDKITLKINLNGLPTAEGVGFNDPKASWKVKYTLRIVDTAAFEKNAVPVHQIKSSTKYKKIGKSIKKGGFKRKQLLNEENRTFSTDVVFDNKTKQMLSSGKSYTFLFRVQYQLKSTFLKKKIKYAAEFPIPAADNEILGLVDGSVSVIITLEKQSEGSFTNSIFRN